VVERRRPLRVAAPGNAVVVCDLVVDAEEDGLVRARELGPPQRPRTRSTRTRLV